MDKQDAAANETARVASCADWARAIPDGQAFERVRAMNVEFVAAAADTHRAEGGARAGQEGRNGERSAKVEGDEPAARWRN